MRKALPKPSKYARILDWANELCEWLAPLANITGGAGVKVSVNPRSVILSAGAVQAGSDLLHSWDWLGTNAENTQVLIGAGVIYRAKRNAASISETWVTIPGGTIDNPVYVVARLGLASGSGQILSKAVQGLPKPSANYYDVPLHSFYKEAGRIVHLRQHRDDDIDVSGVNA